MGARQLRVGSSPRRWRAAVALVVGVALVAALLSGLAPGFRVVAHLLVVVTAVAVAVSADRPRGLAAGAAVAAVVGLTGVLATSAPTGLQWSVESAAVTLAAAAVVLLVPRQQDTPSPEEGPGRGMADVDVATDVGAAAGVGATADVDVAAVDAAVVAFADADARGSTSDALAAGLGVVLPGARLETFQVGTARHDVGAMAGLVLREATTEGRRAVLPAGFSGHEVDVLVGCAVRHGDTEAGGVVIRTAADVEDRQLDAVEAYLRRVAPTLAAHATAELWTALDPSGGRSGRGGRELAAMLSRAAHDLRVPLGSLTGAVETLVTHDETLGPDGRAEVYEILQRSTRRVSEWIGALLEESLGPTRVMPSTRPVELGPLLEEAAENARAATAGLAVTVDDSDVLVEADPGLVIRVLTNLLANAGHHAADGGTVEVRALERGDRVQVRVVDHGPGFDLDDLPDRSASPSDLAGRDGPGLGIGLDSARSVVQSWGGQFGIGRTPGGGATVWFTLPLTRGRTGGGEQPTEREAAATDRGPLETTGAACGTARSAEEAEEAEAGDGRLVRWTVVGPAPGSSAAVFRQRRPRP